METNNWISIESKKPDVNSRVIVFVSNDYLPVQIGVLMKNGSFKIEKWDSKRSDITHWMPIPKTPKGVKGIYSK